MKVLRHHTARPLSLEFSTFAVDGRPDLSKVTYNPATSKDTDKTRVVLQSQRKRTNRTNAR